MRPEDWLHTIPPRLRSLFQRGLVERELKDELRYHLDEANDEYIRRGMKPEEARRAAFRAIEGLEKQKEECRDVRGVRFIENFFQDVRFGLRMLRKAPGFAAVAILTLALGIGANSAIFGFINTLLLRSLPVSDPETLMLLKWSAYKGPQHSSYSAYGDCEMVREETRAGGCSFSEPMLKTLRSQTGSVFADLGAFAGTERINLSGNGSASTVDNAKSRFGRLFSNCRRASSSRAAYRSR